ncbi:hypothetical protein D3C81_1752550 [compost metagenome]
MQTTSAAVHQFRELLQLSYSSRQRKGSVFAAAIGEFRNSETAMFADISVSISILLSESFPMAVELRTLPEVIR